MATLLMFATAREASGQRRDHFDSDTLDELLDAARQRYGERFGAVLDVSRVWVNGDEPSTPDTPLSPADVVAVIPPIAGG